MTKAESDALFMAELHAIKARQKAGLAPTDVFVQQCVAAVERYKRELDIEAAVHKSASSVDNM